MLDNDLYIGHIIKNCSRLFFLFDDCDTYCLGDISSGRESRYGNYNMNSLFLVVGTKEKKYNNSKNQYYILKPLNGSPRNPDKQLVWQAWFFVKSTTNPINFPIVD